MADEYENVSRSKLNIKGDDEGKKKKKKKKNKEKMIEKIGKINEETVKINSTAASSTSTGRPLTKAEESFKKMQEKMQKKRIMDKASMTHKQRVEKFNQHLDNLTEHFDIPKVSWTK